jgi:hypothetical protein
VRPQVWLGFLVFLIVAGQIATGSVNLSLFDKVERQKAPVAFWGLNAVMGLGAAYLIFLGLAR